MLLRRSQPLCTPFLPAGFNPEQHQFKQGRILPEPHKQDPGHPRRPQVRGRGGGEQRRRKSRHPRKYPGRDTRGSAVPRPGPPQGPLAPSKTKAPSSPHPPPPPTLAQYQQGPRVQSPESPWPPVTHSGSAVVTSLLAQTLAPSLARFHSQEKVPSPSTD